MSCHASFYTRESLSACPFTALSMLRITRRLTVPLLNSTLALRPPFRCPLSLQNHFESKTKIAFVCTSVMNLYLTYTSLIYAASAISSFFCGSVAAFSLSFGAGFSFGSKSNSFLRSGKKRLSRFHVSVHNFSWLGSSLGGTRYPLLDMTSRIFFRLSGTASSCESC